MASTLLHSLSSPNPLSPTHRFCNPTQNPTNPPLIFLLTHKNQNPPWGPIKCSTTSPSNSAAPEPNNSNDSPSTFPLPTSTTLNNTDSTFPIERRRKSEIIRERRNTELVKPEPPNFEVGWKRTKEIKLEKPIGYVIMDFLEKLEGLMGREFGSTELLAKAGEIVAERAMEEAEVLRDEGKVEERMVTELFRVLRLMEMDLAMVKAAMKEETLSERLEQAKARCRQAILVANSF